MKEKILKIIEILNSKDNFEKNRKMIISKIVESIKDVKLKEDVYKDLSDKTSRVSFEDIEKEMISIYEEYYTEEEIDKYIEFISSAAGKSFVMKNAIVMFKLTEVIRKEIYSKIEY